MAILISHQRLSNDLLGRIKVSTVVQTQDPYWGLRHSFDDKKRRSRNYRPRILLCQIWNISKEIYIQSRWEVRWRWEVNVHWRVEQGSKKCLLLVTGMHYRLIAVLYVLYRSDESRYFVMWYVVMMVVRVSDWRHWCSLISQHQHQHQHRGYCYRVQPSVSSDLIIFSRPGYYPFPDQSTS